MEDLTYIEKLLLADCHCFTGRPLILFEDIVCVGDNTFADFNPLLLK